MKKQLLGGLGPSLSLRIATIASVCLASCCIAACGGDMPESGGTPPPPPQGNGYLSPGYAYIANLDTSGGPGAIYEYAIAADGSLSPLGVASVATGIDPRSIVADPTGHFVYTANSGDNTISQFAVGASGALTPLSPAAISLSGVPSGAENYSLSVDPAGPYLYVVASGSTASPFQSVIGQFSIGAGGTLTPLSPAYVSLPAYAPGTLTIDPTGSHAYLAGDVGNISTAGSTGEVFEFTIGAGGTLSRLGAGTVSAGPYVVGIALAPSGQGAYVLSDCTDNDCDGSIAPYAITDTGELSAVGAATLTGPHVDPVALIVDGSGSSAYLMAGLMGVDTDFGTLYQYSISSTGALSQTPASFPLTGGATAASRYGPDVYVLSGPAGVDAKVASSVAIYSIGGQGELTSVGSTPTAATTPTGMVLIAAQ